MNQLSFRQFVLADICIFVVLKGRLRDPRKMHSKKRKKSFTKKFEIFFKCLMELKISVAKSEKIYYRLSNWIGSTQSIISSIVATQIFKSYVLLSIYTLCTLNYKTIHIYFYSVTHLFRVCELHRPVQKSY